MAKMPALVKAVSSLEVDTRRLLKTARVFYGLAREPAQQGDCGLNLYVKCKDFMTHIRYHVDAQCNIILDQIEDRLGRKLTVYTAT